MPGGLLAIKRFKIKRFKIKRFKIKRFKINLNLETVPFRDLPQSTYASYQIMLGDSVLPVRIKSEWITLGHLSPTRNSIR